jgi:hypothetical protein
MNTPNLNALEGKWFILYSNFPMWTKGKRDFPSLNYEILQTTSKFNILDHVEFQSKGRHKVIRGFDHHLGNGKFIWRGKGVLSLLRSNWQIVDFQQTWMLIHFKKTLFTPSGYDLVAREPIHIEKYRLELMERKLNLQKIAQNAAT